MLRGSGEESAARSAGATPRDAAGACNPEGPGTAIGPMGRDGAGWMERGPRGSAGAGPADTGPGIIESPSRASVPSDVRILIDSPSVGPGRHRYAFVPFVALQGEHPPRDLRSTRGGGVLTSETGMTSTDKGLGPRQSAVLNAVVEEYIRTGEPVGSKTIVGRYRLGVSSASVRNDMAQLEDLLYLNQPHTSAGRIPTDRGYRYFVDTLENPVRLRAADRSIPREIAGTEGTLDDLLQRATDVVSRVTHYAAAVLAPRLSPARLRRIELVGLASRKVLVVVVTDSGRVEQGMATLDRDVAPAELERVGRDLNHDLYDARLADAHRLVATRAAESPARERALLAGVAESLKETLGASDRVYVGGAAHLAEQETFRRETLHHLYEVLERQSAMLGLLAEALAGPVSVKIGAEIGMPEMQECSIVAAPYAVGGDALGTIGIIGPTRMDYARAMAIAGAVARSIEQSLENLSGR